MGRPDMGRQLGSQGLVVQRDVKIGQHRLACADAFDRGERVGHGEMRRMRLFAQRVHDPAADAGKRPDAVVRQPVDIRRIGNLTDPEAE